MLDQLDELRSTLRRALVQLDALESEARVTRSEMRRLRLYQQAASARRRDEPTDCEVLGVPPSATLAEVRAAYASRVKTAHPDQGGDRATYERLVLSYQRLKDALSPTGPR